MTYAAASSVNRGIMLAVMTLVLILYMYSLLKMIEYGKYTVDAVIMAIMTLLAFALFQAMVMYQDGDIDSMGASVKGLWLMILFLLSYVGFLQNSINRWQNEHISGMSVKDAFDKLPAGLMFYGASGIPIMINEAMQELGRAVLDGPIVDARLFWTMLGDNKTDDSKKDGDNIIVKVNDGRVFTVKRNLLNIQGHEVFELTAVDISREYELTEELGLRRDKARVINTRLKALMGTIEYVTMNRELLQLKTALHDNIGQSILIAKRYLYSPESVDKKRMLDFWSDNIRHLMNDKPEEWELPYYVISREADRLGIRLDMIGELPDDPDIIPIVDAAISVHIGNTLKHADGTVATVSTRKAGSHYIISFTNNGRRPEGKVREGGGLTNLRREVESAGGRMEVLSEPNYMLRIILPADKNRN